MEAPTKGKKSKSQLSGNKATASITCRSLAEFKHHIQFAIEANSNSFIPELTPYQFKFQAPGSLQLTGVTDVVRTGFGLQSNPLSDSLEISIASAFASVEDKKVKQDRQRAVAANIIRVVESIDGYGYYLKHFADTKQLDGYRYRYICRDSYENKDRSANVARRKTTTDQNPEEDKDDEKKSKNKGIFSKPTYDCKGSVRIVFSTAERSITAIYQHLPIHRVEPEAPARRTEQTSATEPRSTKSASKPESASAKGPKTPAKKDFTSQGKKRKRSSKAKPTNVDEDWDYTTQDADLASEQLVSEARGFDPFSSFNNLPTGFSPERSYGNDDYYDQAGLRQSIHGSYGAIQSTAEDEPPKKKSRKKKGVKQSSAATLVEKQSTAGAKKKHTRNKASQTCDGCRKRRRKCDEVHPVCGSCLKGARGIPFDCSFTEES
ncbi:hypothetical protein BT63DRAFT_28460 [Microthyrium microscopicum]|uniref:Zn(2)-C6 fungal-type domain-containing protein n=1 Tax=Microthyrium microscopicum TaxID=703497 RepID=A0A6A6UTG3_9PEZI|nr:hypothetical protein BT63DRAFT_28460 [Microthyrium microscopicum]